MLSAYPGIESASCSQDSLVSIETTNSRALLLSPDAAKERQQICSQEQRASDLDDILSRHAQSQASASMASQRVVLSSAKKRDMQAAQLESTLSRMGRLRFSNQDCLPRIARRESDIQGFIEKLNRLSVDKLADDQRYSPAYQVA
ncbi:hypothetical protein LPJ59_003542 [Coemansia sp. RSA 2399]|nr:hypothetical protein LPJ59_003542 [Coemansia sp. RSA 2399]KAJ1903273.1 hypothetical protein LPJ81_003146 [Coemansia sp. IMI 209127]